VIWGTAILGAAFTALALINDQLHWLYPLTFAAMAIAVLLIAVAPRPAWVALVIAGITAFAVRTVDFAISAPLWDDPCINGGFVCGGTQRDWYRTTDLHGSDDTKYLFELPFLPAWAIVIGLLGWAIRRRSWRTAVAAAVYAAAVWTMPSEAPTVLFAAAAAALGPRKDFRYLAGIGILALALMDPHSPWSLVATIVAIAATLALGVWALVKKDGVNGVVALVALALAALTPFLSAGVLVAASLVQRRAWIGLAATTAAVGLAVFTAPGEVQPGFTTLRGVEISAEWVQAERPDPFSWLIAPGLLLAAAVIATAAALYQHRHRVQTDQANG
jgi:hypothetical protein